MIINESLSFLFCVINSMFPNTRILIKEKQEAKMPKLSPEYHSPYIDLFRNRIYAFVRS